MNILDIFEAAGRRVVVTYPGRFQPFHKGHAEVFHELQSMFGSDNVYIVSSNKTDGDKSPFNFSDKSRFMAAAGVPGHSIIESNKVYDLPAQFDGDKSNTVFITVVGAPDAARLNPGSTKKDGSPSYFQKWPGSVEECQSADKHGYVIVESEKPQSIVIGGKKYDVSHGTPTRALWNQVRNDDKLKQEFIAQLYGKYSQDLEQILNKIPANTTEVAEALAENLGKYPTKSGAEKHERQVQYSKHAGESIEENAEELHVGDPVIITGDVQFHGKTGDIDSFGRDKRFVIVNLYNHGKHSFHSSDVSYNDYTDEEESLSEDAAGVGVVKNGKDPRYVMATTGDDNKVTADTLPQMMKNLNLIPGKKKTIESAEYDTELRQTKEFAKQHYQGRTEQEAFEKFVARSIMHSKEADQKQEVQIDKISKALVKIERELAQRGLEVEEGMSDSFRNRERNAGLETETNNIAIAINGKTWKVIPGKGYADSKEEWAYLNNMKNWAAKKSASSGKKWTVHLTGAPVTVSESAEKAKKFCDSCDSVITKTPHVCPGTASVEEEKQRLDPKCWSGYKKQGTKMKGDTRVNNCVKVDESLEESLVNEINPHNYDSDEDYYNALKAPAKPRYRGTQSPGVNPDDEAYFREIFRKKRLAAQQAERDADHDRLATGTNESEEQDATEFYVYIGSEDAGQWIGSIVKDGGKWREMGGEGTKPHNWGSSYMSYLSPDEVMQWIRQDYRRGYTVEGPFYSDAEVYDYAEQMGFDDVMEAFGLYGPFTVTINTGERPQSRTKTKKFRREDDAILWAQDWLEDAPQYVFATAQVTDPDGNVVWTTDESLEEGGVDEHIVKVKGGYELRSKHGNKNLGKYPTKAGAEKRERQVQYFKHANESTTELEAKKDRFRSLKKKTSVSESDWLTGNEVEETIYQYDSKDPFNSEFAPAAGMGRMTLRNWKMTLSRRLADIARYVQQATDAGNIDKADLWDGIYKKLEALNLEPIAKEIELGHAELEKIRQQGGVRSRAFRSKQEQVKSLEESFNKNLAVLEQFNPRRNTR